MVEQWVAAAARRGARLMVLLVCALTGAQTIAHGGDGRYDRDNDCPDGREITLVNGRIHTMDRHNRVVSTLTIRNGNFATSATTTAAASAATAAARSSTCAAKP